jgi:hypothetical protein
MLRAGTMPATVVARWPRALRRMDLWRMDLATEARDDIAKMGVSAPVNSAAGGRR